MVKRRHSFLLMENVKPAGYPRSQLSLLVVLALVAQVVLIGSAPYGQRQSGRKLPIVDSAKTVEEAFDGLDPRCPQEIRNTQSLVQVSYYSTDHRIHQGQVVIDRELENDIKVVFGSALQMDFPIHSVVPISDPRFRKDGKWDDELSMEDNNTSAFNYRQTTGAAQLSNHAYGRAIDMNPFLNPYIKGGMVLPHNSKYGPSVDGTLTSSHPIVFAFKRMGWKWGVTGSASRTINIVKSRCGLRARTGTRLTRGRNNL
jgi:peptidoglycan L-alanyl-D-glutamate endopeptidase CwlK